MSSLSLRPGLGLDLGTLVTVAVEASEPDATTEIASAVALGDDGFVLGAQAEQVLTAHPARGTRQLKQRFGDTTPVVLDGRAIQPDALVGALLLGVVTGSGIDISTATLALTHPASWRGYKLELLRTIGTSLGFVDVELIAEPLAAARRYASAGRISTGDTVAIYDLGGTFDAAIVSLSESGPSLVGTSQSLEHCGGAEFDQLVFKHVAVALGGVLEQLDRNDDDVRRAVALLRSACTVAKHDLSTKSDASISVVMPGLDTSVRMTRDEFETALRPYITETLQALDRTIAAAGMTPSDLAGVVLSGGGSRIPLVAEMVAGHLGRPVLNAFDPRLVVASGAAQAAASTPRETTQPSTSIADAASASPRETIMTDQTTPPADSAPGTPTGGRPAPAPPPAAKKQGASKAAKIAGGAAAAAAAVAAGVMYGDDIVEAAGGGDDDAAGGQPGPPDDGTIDGGSADEPFKSADHLEREAAADDDSMDAFEAVVSSGAGPVAEPIAGPLGTPLAESAGTTPTEASSRPTPRAESESSRGGGDGAQPRTAGAADVQHPAPAQGRGADGGPADAPSAGASQAASHPVAPVEQPAPPSVDAEFETARATLLERLENFEAPAGTSPEDAQRLRQELTEAVERFDPAPGQTTQEALAEMRDEYDQRLQDFTQDQKIDALIQEAQRDNEADAATLADADTPPAVPDGDAGLPDAGVPDDAPIDDGTTDDGTTDDGTASESSVLIADHPDSAEPAPTDAGMPDAAPTDEAIASESFVLIADPQERAEPATDDVADPAVAKDVDSDAEDTSATETLDFEVDPAAILIGLDQPVDPAAILIGLDQPVDPAAILIGLDQPVDGGLRDDFDLMIAEPSGESLLAASDYLAPSGRSLDVKGDDGVVDAPFEITDVRATYVPPAEQPVLIGDAGADIPSPIHLADDVLGDISVASMVGHAEPTLVDLDAPTVIDAPGTVAGLIETDQVIEIVEIHVDPIAEIEPIPVPVDDLELDDVGFAADLAGDITPAAPDTLSFEP